MYPQPQKNWQQARRRQQLPQSRSVPCHKEIEGAAKGIAVRAQDGATEAEEIHKRARETKDNTVKNRAMVTKMLSEIRESLEKALEDAKVVDQIGVLAESILNITGQTNLLALNASHRSGKSRRSRQGICGSSR